MKLTDDQILELKDMFPPVPNPLHEPFKFMYYVRLYLAYKGRLNDY